MTHILLREDPYPTQEDPYPFPKLLVGRLGFGLGFGLGLGLAVTCAI